MNFTSDNLAVIISAIAILMGAYATYRNTVRKTEFDRLQYRVLDTEKRLAESDKRASDNERRAIDNEHRADEYREDIQQLGRAIDSERKENARRLAIVVTDGNTKIQKVVIVLEKVLADMEAATGSRPDVDLDALKRLVVIDSVTGQLGPIDVAAVKSLS